MMKRTMRCVLAAALVAGSLPVLAQTFAPTRGALLYGNHCSECHSTEMHWRDKRLAQDWDSLKAQVRRWQAVAKLNWSEEDISEVTRHLNNAIYQFPEKQAVR